MLIIEMKIVDPLFSRPAMSPEMCGNKIIRQGRTDTAGFILIVPAISWKSLKVPEGVNTMNLQPLYLLV